MSQVDEVQAVFDEWAQNGRAEGMERGHGPTAIQAFDRLELKNGNTYLDIGCGNGYTLRWAVAAQQHIEAWGIDVAPEMISLAKRMTESREDQTEFHYVHGVFPSTILPANYFDAIFSMEVFYYFPSIDDGLLAVSKLLVPGGRFTCIVDYYQENQASHSWPDDTGVSMTLWSAEQWRDGFERAGLKVLEQTRLHPQADDEAEDWKRNEGSLMTLGTLVV